MNFVAAILYMVAVAVLTGVGLGFRAEGWTPLSAALALGAGALVGLFAWWRGRGDAHKLERPRGWGWVPVVLYGLFAARAFLWLIWRQGDDLRVLSPNNWGDMSLHLTFIENFRHGFVGWPDSPIYSGGKLAYAAGMDFFNAQLALVGVDVVHGLVWVGLIGAILTGLALWRWGGAFTLMGFLCLGGLLGFAALGNLGSGGEPFFQDYAGNQKFDWAWKSLPLALLVTQRGFLFALPAGLLLLSSWRTRFFRAGDGWRLPFLGELLLYASMPLFHVHTFIVLSLLLGVFFLCSAGARWRITGLAGAALIPATVLLWLTTGMGQATRLPMWGNMSDVEHPPDRPSPHVLGWEPGWMESETLPPQSDFWEQLTRGGAAMRAARGPFLFFAYHMRPASAKVAAAFTPHGRFLFFWLGNFGLWPFVAGALALTLLRGMARGPIPTRWAWWSALVFVVVTPLLGSWPEYQKMSVSELLTGPGPGTTGRHIAVAMFAAAALVMAFTLRAPAMWARALRLAGFGFAGLVVLNAAWVGAMRELPRLPLLPLNSLPLLAATAALFALLVTMARRWEAPLWPAAFVFPALYLFFLACNVMFAPSSWDNTKILIWAVLILLPFLWESLLIRWPRWPRAVALVMLFFSGFVGLLGGLDGKFKGYPVVSLEELARVRAAVQVVPQSETIAAAPIFNHPLLLAGRRLVLGWVPHVSSHGLPTGWHVSKLNTLMNGDDEWRLAAAELGVRYLWWGPEEEAAWPQSRQSWRRAAQVVSKGAVGELFDLETPLAPVAP